MTNILEVQNLSKSYQKKSAVIDVSFQLRTGESYGLLGPNGAGKSTIINMLAGILAADNGEIFIGGNSVKQDRKKAQMLIGVVPQEIALYSSMSAEANLRFFAKLYGLTGSMLEKAVKENLQLVGLYERRKEPIEKYSGGMKRRINIAAALLHAPRLLIMDEPTVGIDPQSRSHILETIKKLQIEKGVSILYTSHYMEEVEAICDRVGIIDQGRLIQEGTIAELKSKFADISQIKIVPKELELLKKNLSFIQEGLAADAEEYDNGIIIKTLKPNEALPKIMEIFNQIKCEVKTIEILEPNLETIFLSLTGRSLRDD